MYSHVGIIISAVVSSLLGLYVFVPDAGLRTFDFWLSIWQPVVWDVPAILRLPSIDRVGANGLPLWLGGVQNKQEEMIEISTEDLMERLHRLDNLLERLQGQSDPLGPEIGPEIPPPFEPEPLAHLVPLHEEVISLFFILCQYFVFFVLPCLIPIVLVQKTYALRKMRKLYEAEKCKNAELVEKLGRRG